MTKSLRQAAGSLLVVGLAGKELSAMERAWLRLIRPAGIILYRRNIADAKQTRALLDEATAFCTANATRFVDVEGGTVNRLGQALAPIPSAQAVSVAAQQSADYDLAREHGALIAQAIRAFGFNTALAPMVDLGLPESAEVMQTRCAAPAAADVVAYARAFLRGLKEEKIVGCGKHFPGLGGGTRDSHLETPAIRRSWPDMWNEDLEPYRALRAEMPMVMINHAAYPLTADPTQPASVSKFWIETILRKRIGYRGIILSDDLEMGGVLKFMPIQEAAVAAVRVGSDLVEICHHAEPILESYEALVTEGERSAAFRGILFARATETARKKARVFHAPIAPALSPKQLEALRARVLRYGEKIAALAPGVDTPKAPTPVTLVGSA
jgi:beta-N-acetylhexosaminidase